MVSERDRAAVLAWAFDGRDDVAVAVDAEGRVTYANARARARLPALEPGVALVDLFPPGESREATRAAIATALAGRTAPLEWRDDAPGRRVRSFLAATASPLGEGRRVDGCLVVGIDATDAKRVEQRLREGEQLMIGAQSVAHLGTWEWDVSEPNASWSAELYRIYGVTPETYTPSYEGYLGKVHPEDRDRVRQATERVFQHHTPYSHDERIVRPDGSVRWLHTWAHPVLDGSGKLARLVGVCQDITERHLAEEQVRVLNADLERRVAERTRTIENSMKDLDAFNAQVSHDLRAPLSIIHGSCALLRREPLSAAATQHLARVERAVAHMNALVGDLLTLARVGQVALHAREVDVSAVASEILADLAVAAPGRTVEGRVEPGIYVVGDPTLLRVALENLLGNAWKYSSREPRAVIEVGARRGNAEVTVHVRDNGAGFDMAEAPRLFAPFERLHAASEFEGTGVGLAAVHRIVERHGGRIWAESAPGAGATFFMALPSTQP